MARRVKNRNKINPVNEPTSAIAPIGLLYRGVRYPKAFKNIPRIIVTK
jgi:hypothetical protein